MTFVKPKIETLIVILAKKKKTEQKYLSVPIYDSLAPAVSVWSAATLIYMLDLSLRLSPAYLKFKQITALQPMYFQQQHLDFASNNLPAKAFFH